MLTAPRISTYDVWQFRPAICALILLGISGFAFAADSPGAWVLATGAILLHIWLVQTGRFRPLPRIVSNVVTIIGVVVLYVVLQQSEITPLITIGHFLVLLQVVKLYEQHANRDYAQLLILSLLLMVAAAISTASLIFGLMLIAYLFLSLYCCLLFHLKVEADHARQISGVPDFEHHPAVVRSDQTNFAQSMRRLIAVIASVAVASAIVTFLFFPRGAGQGLFGQGQFKISQSLTGFSDTVSFQNVARITQNTQEVATVKVDRMDLPYQGVLLLRGLTLDKYTGDGSGGVDDRFVWRRTIENAGMPVGIGRRDGRPFGAGQGSLHQQISLKPTGTNALFAIGGISFFKPNDDEQYRYFPQEEVLQRSDPIQQRITYEVWSRDKVAADMRGGYFNRILSDIDPKIKPFAMQPEVSGSDEDGRALAPRRNPDAMVTLLDGQIAKSIESYLRNNFTYTLDLTDATGIGDKDPLVAFLYDLKRGHCEYFAGAMTLLCQSLGIRARMVVGFKCDEYNLIGDYYTVRQSHAHAWVEVLTQSEAGELTWETFDPTATDEGMSSRSDTLWQNIHALFSYFEYQWENAVIAYDQSRRNNLLVSVDRQVRSAASESSQAVQHAWNWQGKIFVSLNILNALVGLTVAALVLSICWFVWERSRLRRRARRIGIDSLPLEEQMKLARQLRFFDELVRLLERHNIHRGLHQTPMEFCRSLAYLPSEAFDSIRRLTDVFYQIRYGRAELSPEQQRQLVHAIVNVENSLGART